MRRVLVAVGCLWVVPAGLLLAEQGECLWAGAEGCRLLVVLAAGRLLVGQAKVRAAAAF